MTAQPGRITVPERLTGTVRLWEGDAGLAWLADLPGRFADQLARRGLVLERICEPGGRISLVGYVHRADDLAPAVLKLGVVNRETDQEHAALAHWAGRGAVLLLAAEPEHGVLVLERLHGDIPLRSLAEAKAMLEAVGLLQRLWVPPGEGHPFTSVGERVAGLSELIRERRGLPEAAAARPLIDEALETAAGLLADEPERLLLHGDFHHGNVLAADRSPWLAIDPRPLVGERAYDLARLARDRLDTLAGSPGQRGALRRRLQQLAGAVEVDQDRLRGWTLFRTVEAGLWHLSTGAREQAELYLEFASWL
ncbi:aminoglycoside phosphotransferase family protein [Kitasatospora sp. NPDC094015]|uniref:aminoglycoside phosphotransferase family protein n=1 Tax=Kitasatospora sp. NPDC094015 TaxID=3155205 RepID=UPI003316B8A5